MTPGGRFVPPAVAMVGVAVVVLCGGCGQNADLTVASVPVESSGMAVSVRDLLVQQVEGRQEWSFTLVCDQPAGCRGTVRLEVGYLSKGQVRTVVALRDVDLPHRGEVRVGRGGPPEAVDRVEQVRVEVVRRQPAGPTPAPGGPRPTPRS